MPGGFLHESRLSDARFPANLNPGFSATDSSQALHQLVLLGVSSDKRSDQSRPLRSLDFVYGSAERLTTSATKLETRGNDASAVWTNDVVHEFQRLTSMSMQGKLSKFR